jgi:hypothetical protein
MKTVIGFAVGHLATHRPEEFQLRRHELWGFLGDGLLRPAIHAELPLADVAKAREIRTSRPAGGGRSSPASHCRISSSRSVSVYTGGCVCRWFIHSAGTGPLSCTVSSVIASCTVKNASTPCAAGSSRSQRSHSPTVRCPDTTCPSVRVNECGTRTASSSGPSHR